MFCANCGAQYGDDGKFCPNCGTPNSTAQQPAAPQEPTATNQPVYQQPVYQQPVAPQQPVYQQPAYQPPVRQPVVVAPATTYQKKMAVLIALVAIFALVIGFAHTFCLVDLPMSIDVEVDTGDLGLGSLSDMGMVSSAIPTIELDGSVGGIYVSPSVISEAFDLLDAVTAGEIDASFGMGYVGLISFGLLNLAIAAVGILFYLRAKSNNSLFDQFLGNFCKGKTPATLMGLVGVVACLLQIVCMWFTGFSEEAMGQSAGISVGVHWITWIALIIYGALAGSQLLAIDKEEA